MYYHPDLGPNYLKRLLSEMDIAVSRDKAQIVSWLAAGQYSIFLFSDAQRMDFPLAKEQGLPIDWFGPKAFKEGAIYGAATGVVGLINKAPHPNAARVALNWLLSKEGQLVYQRVWKKADSLRIDISKEDVPEYSRRQEGVFLMDTDRPEWMDMKDIIKLVKESYKRG
jgi:iron(III) transport system substrate-binding protein